MTTTGSTPRRFRPLAPAAALRLGAAAAALACGATAAQAAHLPKNFKAVINAAQAGTTEPADGLALLELDGMPGAATLDFRITFSEGVNFASFGGGGDAEGDMVTAMHIHNAGLGMNGPVIFDVLGDDDVSVSAVTGGTLVEGVWDSSEGLDDHYTAFEEATGFTEFYFNLHTEDFPAGAIRGQIETDMAPVPVPAAAPLLAAALGGMGLLRLRRRG